MAIASVGNTLRNSTLNGKSFEPALLGRMATRIVKEVKGIYLVVYDYISKRPGNYRVGVAGRRRQ